MQDGSLYISDGSADFDLPSIMQSLNMNERSKDLDNWAEKKI